VITTTTTTAAAAATTTTTKTTTKCLSFQLQKGNGSPSVTFLSILSEKIIILKKLIVCKCSV
jgi:hypothetical protein